MADLGAIGQLTAPDDFFTVLGPAVSGNVTDVSSAPAGVVVRVYKRSDGSFFRAGASNSAGYYTIPFPPISWSGVEVQVVFVDPDTGDVENDLILRTYPV